MEQHGRCNPELPRTLTQLTRDIAVEPHHGSLQFLALDLHIEHTKRCGRRINIGQLITEIRFVFGGWNL